MPVSCFLFKLGEAKPIEKWSTYIKLEELTFSSLQRRFTVDGYEGFQEKACQFGFDKVDYTFGGKHKVADPPDFPNGRLFTVNCQDEWEIYQEFLFSNAREYELIAKTQFYSVHEPQILSCA